MVSQNAESNGKTLDFLYIIYVLGKLFLFFVFESTICCQKGVVTARPWIKSTIRASLNHPPFRSGVIIWSQEIEKANYSQKFHLSMIKQGRAIRPLELNWNKTPLAHSKKMLNYWWPQSKEMFLISKIEKVREAPQMLNLYLSHTLHYISPLRS